MRKQILLPLALMGMLGVAGCQSLDADTTMKTAGGAAVGAAGGAIIGAITGKPGTGAAAGAALGAASGFLYDQYQKSSYSK